MVAAKRGRGAKNQTVKSKPEAEETSATEGVEPMEGTEEIATDNNGDTQPEHGSDTAPTEEVEENKEEQAGGEIAQEAGEAEKPEEPKEEKIESGKLLIENLPSSYLFDYQDKLKEMFSMYGEVINVKRGPIIVTELTTTPTLSAIVEFKNKDSLEKALCENGAVVDGNVISVAVESRADTAVLVGVPYEACTDYVRKLFAQCGQVAHIHEFSKTKYKILRVTFLEKESVEKALKLDRELRINGFLVTVSKYRDEEEQKAHSANTNKNKRQQNQSRAPNASASSNANAGGNSATRQNNYRPRGGANATGFNARGGGGGGGGSFRGSRGRGGFGARGGAFPRGGFAPANSYMPPQPYMGRPQGFMNDGQRPNKRVRL